MSSLKGLVTAAIISGLVAAMPGTVLAQPMMGPGMGYGNMGHGMMGPGMMGGYGMGPGTMGPGMMGGYGMGLGMMGPGMMGDPYSGVNLSDEQNAKIAAIQEEFSKNQWDAMT